jgi:hypothetical protein
MDQMTKALISSCLAFVFISGCNTVDYRAPVTAYASSVSATSTIFTTYYSQQNTLARDHYLLRVKYDKSPIYYIAPGSNDETGLLLKYSAGSLRARIQALNLIREFGVKLLSVINSTEADDAPRSIQSISTEYNASIMLLSNETGFFKTGKTISDATTSLVSSLSKLYINHKKNEAIKEAILSGGPAVNQILVSLKRDISALATQNKTDYLESAKDITDRYNKQITDQSFSDQQRNEILMQISKFYTLYENSLLTPPDTVFTALINANNELIEYANNPTGEGALNKITASLSALNGTIKPFSDFYNSQR